MADTKKPAAQTEAKPKEAKKKVIAAYKPAGRLCPKCGSRMATHADRNTCGRCGYTEFKKKE